MPKRASIAWGGSILTRAAASSIAKGNTSRRAQISATARIAQLARNGRLAAGDGVPHVPGVPPREARGQGVPTVRCGAYTGVHAPLQGPLSAVRDLAPPPCTLERGSIAGLGVSVVFLAACLMTTQVFPIHYGDLLNLRPPEPDLLLARNLLLVLLWSLLLLPRNTPEKETQ